MQYKDLVSTCYDAEIAESEHMRDDEDFSSYMSEDQKCEYREYNQEVYGEEIEELQRNKQQNLKEIENYTNLDWFEETLRAEGTISFDIGYYDHDFGDDFISSLYFSVKEKALELPEQLIVSIADQIKERNQSQGIGPEPDDSLSDREQ